MRWRVVAVAAAAGALVVVTAGPALAKGADQVTISGPDLARPIVLDGGGEPGTGERLSTLSDGSGLFLAMFGASNGQALTSAAPVGPLGPKYELAYRVPGGAPTPDLVRQDLYPMAAGGPVTYTAAGQTAFGGQTKTNGGWYRAPSGFVALLAGLGIPVPPSGSPSAPVAAKAGSGGAGSGDGVPWGVWAVVGAALVLGVVAVGYARRRGWVPHRP